MLKNEGDRLTRVIVCTPQTEYFNVTDLKAQGMNEFPDPEQTKMQHDRLKSIMADFGAEVLDMDIDLRVADQEFFDIVGQGMHTNTEYRTYVYSVGDR